MSFLVPEKKKSFKLCAGTFSSAPEVELDMDEFSSNFEINSSTILSGNKRSLGFSTVFFETRSSDRGVRASTLEFLIPGRN